MDNLIIASMAGNFISANFLELRQYSYYVMSKIVFFNLYIFLDLLYLIVFFQTSLPNFNIYTSSLTNGRHAKISKGPFILKKALLCNILPAFSFGYLAHYTLTIWKGIKICKTSPFGFQTYRSTLKRIMFYGKAI